MSLIDARPRGRWFSDVEGLFNRGVDTSVNYNESDCVTDAFK
eukprot:COSAG02_NODE_5268_length_4484_cov_1.709920_4_plen_42_part_00